MNRHGFLHYLPIQNKVDETEQSQEEYLKQLEASKNFIKDQRKLIKSASYRKAFIQLDRYLMQQFNQIPPYYMISILRRLFYCGYKILMTYVQRDEIKTKKVAAVLMRKLGRYLDLWHKIMENALDYVQVFEDSGMEDCCPSTYSQIYYLIDSLQSFMQLQCYKYKKLYERIFPQISSMLIRSYRLNELLILEKKHLSEFKMNKLETELLVGQLYGSLDSPQIAIDYYYNCFQIIQDMIDKIMKLFALKKEYEDKGINFFLKLISWFQFSLFLQALFSEKIKDYARMNQCIILSKWVQHNFFFENSFAELCSLVGQVIAKQEFQFRTYFNEEGEIGRIINQIFNPQEDTASFKNLNQFNQEPIAEFNDRFYEKYEVQKLNQSQYIYKNFQTRVVKVDKFLIPSIKSNDNLTHRSARTLRNTSRNSNTRPESEEKQHSQQEILQKKRHNARRDGIKKTNLKENFFQTNLVSRIDDCDKRDNFTKLYGMKDTEQTLEYYIGQQVARRLSEDDEAFFSLDDVKSNSSRELSHDSIELKKSKFIKNQFKTNNQIRRKLSKKIKQPKNEISNIRLNNKIEQFTILKLEEKQKLIEQKKKEEISQRIFSQMDDTNGSQSTLNNSKDQKRRRQGLIKKDNKNPFKIYQRQSKPLIYDYLQRQKESFQAKISEEDQQKQRVLIEQTFDFSRQTLKQVIDQNRKDLEQIHISSIRKNQHKQPRKSKEKDKEDSPVQENNVTIFTKLNSDLYRSIKPKEQIIL